MEKKGYRFCRPMLHNGRRTRTLTIPTGAMAVQRWMIPSFKWTIFPKLVLALMLVVTPLYGIGLYMNESGKSRLNEEMSKSLTSRVGFHLNSLEIEHEHMMNLLQQSLRTKDIQQITFMSETMSLFEFTEVIRRIQEQLVQLKGSSVYAKNVSAHIMTLGRTLSTEHSITDELGSDFEAVRELSETGGSGLLYWQDRLFLAASYPGVEGIQRRPGFIVVVELDQTAIRQALQPFHTDYEQSGAALFYLEQGLVLGRDRGSPMLDRLNTVLASKYNAEDYNGLEELEEDGTNYLFVYQYSPILGGYFTAYLPRDEFLGPIHQHRTMLWVLSILAGLLCVLYAYWLYRLIHRPLQHLIKAFRKVEKGKFEPVELPQPNDEFLYLFQRFNSMTDRLNVLVHQVYEQRLREQSLELKQLQAQINPHFLYNTYFILYRLAKLNDNESIARFSQYLGEYFQYITRNGAEEVPLELELRHSKTYVEIQNIRFKDRIAVEFGEPPQEARGLTVPRLILQPIIENAYKYGLEVKRKNGKIRVKLELDHTMLTITVEDNGEKLTEESIASVQEAIARNGGEMELTGLLNVHRRLLIRYGECSGVRVSRSELGGMKVVLRLQVDETAAAIPQQEEGA